MHLTPSAQASKRPWSGRIIFVKRTCVAPSGGHRQIRLLVACINRLGIASEVMFSDRAIKKYPVQGDDWSFGIKVPISPCDFSDAAMYVQPHDVLIFPETNIQSYLKHVHHYRCLVAVFIQNAFYALDAAPANGYFESGVSFVLVTSTHISELATHSLGMPPNRIVLLPCCVEYPGFFDDSVTRKIRRVCYMPRKLPEHAEAIRAIVSKQFPDIEWIPIEFASDQKVSAAFRSCSVFLSTQDREGFGLPAIEAMRCGCVVAGYRGTDPFPHPYATEANGFWAKDRSVSEAAQQLSTALIAVSRGGPSLEAMRSAAKATVDRYSEKAFEKNTTSLISFASQHFTSTFSP